MSAPAAPAVLIAIDPGYAGQGNAVAEFLHGFLYDTWFNHLPCVGQRADVVVIEKPQQDARSENVPPKILINLAWEGALLAGAFCGRDGARLVAYTPSEWKGSTPKPVHHKRLWRVLSAAEQKVLGGAATEQAIDAACRKGASKRWGITGAKCYPASFDTHNLLDAAALGAFHLGRIGK